ncbi:MAG TPA: hypothetical protein VFY93_09415 [Planctomycetota bacterium]|nr:hypothetical protein [Planctomycetota bacterium]
MQVEGGAFSTPEFKEFSTKVVPFMHVTTRIEGRKDEGLLAEKGGRGFPYIVFMDEEGGVLAVQGERTVAGFQKTLADKVQRFLDLRAKAKAGDPAAQIELTLLEGDLGRISFEEVQTRLKGKKLTDEQQAMLGDVELGAMISELQKSEDEAAAKPRMKRIADTFASGRLPRDAEKKQMFLQITLSYAVSEEDPDLVEKAFGPLKAIYEQQLGNDPRVQEWARKIEDKIAEMRDAQKGSGSDSGIEEGCGEGCGEGSGDK